MERKPARSGAVDTLRGNHSATDTVIDLREFGDPLDGAHPGGIEVAGGRYIRRVKPVIDWLLALVALILVLPVMALFIPIHVGAALFVLMAMTVTSVTNHAGWEILPRKWIDGWVGDNIISATHHNMHHIKYQGNYGLHFRLWDKLMRTDIMQPVAVEPTTDETKKTG